MVPPFPKVLNLDAWKAATTTNVLAACADPHQEDWVRWLQEAYKPFPDIEKLNDSGGVRYDSVDVKLASAMISMLKGAGDGANDLSLDVNLKANAYIRGNQFTVIKGRQIIAMMLESFRTRDRIDVIYTIDHFTKIQYPGGNKLAVFKATWLEVIGRMRPEDVPSKNALRDLLYLKIKGSTVMKLELQLLYEIHAYDDAERSYEKLLQIMDRAIARQRESKNLQDTNTGLHQMVQGRKLLAAPAPEPKAHPPAPPNPNPPKNDGGGGGGKTKTKGEANDAAPVYAQAEAKRRAKEKAKAKTKDGGRQRSTSNNSNRDTSNIRCKFFFSDGGCSAGKQCPYSHKEKEPKKGKGKGKGRPRSGSPSATSREGSPSSDPASKNCLQWMRGGKCNREACPYKHDPSYATPAKTEKAKAKAEAKEKAKSKAKAKSTPAAPVVSIIDSEDEGESSCSEWEEVDTDASTGDDAAVSKATKAKKSVSFAKGTAFSSSKPRRSMSERGAKIRKVNVDMLYDPQHTEQVYDCHKARAKAQLMRSMVLQKRQPKLEISQIRVPGSDILITVVYNRKANMFYELAPNHAYLKGLPEVRHICMVQPELSRSQMKFIMDTGCGHDLVSQSKVTRNDLESFVGDKTMHFQTANGTTDSDIVTKFSTNCFDEPVETHILESSPSVLSVGKRCMNHGYSFVWPDGREPYMINKEGQRIQMYVKGDIPYIKVGSEKSERMDDEESLEVFKTLKKFKGGDLEPLEEKVISKEVNDSPSATDGADEKATPGLDADGEEIDPEHADDADDEGVEDEIYEGGEEAAIEDDEVVDEEPPPPIPAAEHDEDEVEVDDGEGVPRRAKVGTLKAEAGTLSHLCTHRYRNPYCQSCIRAKMRHFKTRRGAFKRKIEHWGDLVTFDFVDMRDAKDRGVGVDDDAREILVIRDIATKIVAAYPTASRSTDDVVRCLQRFKGKRKIKTAYSDEAGEFTAAADRLGIVLDNSLPGRPRNNSIAERTNQFVLDTTSTCLLQAGLPASYWPYAINCVTHNLNIEDVEGESSWMRMSGERFRGKAIPFGAKVFFKPTETREPTYGGKFDPKGIPGVFAGYVMGSGHTWSRKHRVWDLADFGTVNLGMNAKVPGFLRKPYITEVVILPDVIEFPLKGEYERMNSSLEGIKEVYELDGKGSKDAKMLPEEEEDILDGLTDDDGGDDPGGDGPSGGGGKSKKSVDAPPRPEAPTELASWACPKAFSKF